LTGTLVIGHRGARGLWPENTLAGFEHALELGADMIELDVQVTADGVAAVVHDTVLTGALYRRDGTWLPDPGLPVNAVTWADLRSLDAGRARPDGLVALAFPEQRPLGTARIPRLSEALELLARYDAPILLEIKRDITDPAALPAARCAEAVLNEIDGASKGSGEIVVQSFDWTCLAEVRKHKPQTRIAALSSENGSPRNVYRDSPWLGRWAERVWRHGVCKVLADNGWSTWSAAYEDLDPDRIRTAHDFGLQVFGWTVNDAGRAEELVAQGIDGLITDYPDRIPSRARR
jgi:glycerophosphoryl diester phosphodiesterase